nr:MAG TPA: hypothetical protein [Caudoviricetes sp.]
MMLQGGVSYDNLMNNNPLGSMGGSSGSGGAGQSLGNGGMVQGGNAPGIWGEIKKEVDARKAGVSNALQNYATGMQNIASSANSFRTNFNPQTMPIAPLQTNLYNYLTR